MGTVLLGAALLAGCSLQPAAEESSEEASAAEQQVKTVKTVKIGKAQIGEPLEQVADVLPSVQIDVFAKASAEVEAVLKKQGEPVAEGETVIRLKQDDARLALDAAELGLRSAQRSYATGNQQIANQKQELANRISRMEQQVRDLQESYNLMRNQYDMGNVSERELEKAEENLGLLRADLALMKSQQRTMEAQLTFESYEIQLKQAQIQVEQAQRQLDNFEIKAPIGGLLTELPVEVAMTAQPGMKVMQIVQTDPVKIKAELTQASADLIRGKRELSFYIPGIVEKTQARVAFLSPMMNSATRSYTLELEVPNPEGVVTPGMKAQVFLSEEADQIVLAVPTSSIVREGSRNYVFVLKGGTVERREVELGRLSDTMQEVLSGIAEGEDLVVSGQHQLADGEQVQLAGS